MQIATLISKISERMDTTSDDVEFNQLSLLVNRLSHIHEPFETPLTNAEIKLLQKFL